MPFVSLGRYIPKFFILFIAKVNGIVSLISLSVFSLLVYRNARDLRKDSSSEIKRVVGRLNEEEKGRKRNED